MQYNAMECNAVQYNALCNNTTQCNIREGRGGKVDDAKIRAIY